MGASVIAWTELPRQVIEAGPVRLRPFRPTDTGDLIAGCNDPLTRRFAPALPSPYTTHEAQWWVERGAPDAFGGGGAAYAIADTATDRLIGGITLAPTSEVGRRATVGYWVAPWARSRGAATTATRALSDLAFEHGLHRLDLLTAPENTPSQRVALAAGYRREGVLRGVAKGRDGTWEDRVVWARLAEDPPGRTPRLLPDLPGGPVRGSLSDGVVLLRPLRAQDAASIHALHQVPDVVSTSVPPIAPDREEIELRCARSAGRWLAGERADLVITDAATGVVAGDIGLYSQGPYYDGASLALFRAGLPGGFAQQAMVGYALFPTWRGRGYATRAVRLLARWAFDHAGVIRLVADTVPDNTGSQRVLQRVGFRREGYQRGRLTGQADQRRIDSVLFALLPQDAAPRVPRPRRRPQGARLSKP